MRRRSLNQRSFSRRPFSRRHHGPGAAGSRETLANHRASLPRCSRPARSHSFCATVCVRGRHRRRRRGRHAIGLAVHRAVPERLRRRVARLARPIARQHAADRGRTVGGVAHGAWRSRHADSDRYADCRGHQPRSGDPEHVWRSSAAPTRCCGVSTFSSAMKSASMPRLRTRPRGRTRGAEGAGAEREPTSRMRSAARVVGSREPGVAARARQGVGRGGVQAVVEIGAGAALLQRGPGSEPSGQASGSGEEVSRPRHRRTRIRPRVFEARRGVCGGGPAERSRDVSRSRRSSLERLASAAGEIPGPGDACAHPVRQCRKPSSTTRTSTRSCRAATKCQFALATLYKDAGAYDNARKRFAQLLPRDPKYIEALLGAGQVESWSGNGRRSAGLPESRASAGRSSAATTKRAPAC